MQTYAYKAKKHDGELVTGTLVAESERSAIDMLDAMRVFPIEVAPVEAGAPAREGFLARRGALEAGPSKGRGFPSLGRRRVKPRDVGSFAKQLSDLLRAGVSMERALATLSRQESNPHFGRVISEIRNDVSAGNDLASAMEAYPEVFARLQVSMVRAGETGGFLESVLSRIALFSEKEEEIRSRILSAMAYPILLSLVGTATVIFLLVFFIPRFTEIFKDLGGALPLPTQILLAMSGAMEAAWPFILGGGLVAALALKRAADTERGRRVVDSLKLSLPAIRAISLRTAIGRFARTLGSLLKSGVPILTALDISRDAVGNALLADVVADASSAVREGKSLAEPLRKSPHFPPAVVDMIAVGQESGNLDEVLLDISDSFDREVDRATKLLISLLEPAMILLMAGLVGFIVISMLLPVFSLNSMVR